jgi:Xaa-Pro aminopeptidase
VGAFETASFVAALEREFETRIKNIRSVMSGADEFSASALILACRDEKGWEDVYYLSGFPGSSGVLVITPDEANLFVDSRYIALAGETCACGLVHCTAERRRTPLRAAAEYVAAMNLENVAFGGAQLTYSIYRELCSVLKNAKLIDFSNVLMNMRRHKSDAEVSCIMDAAGIAERAFQYAVEDVSAGASEREFAAMLEYAARAGGGDFSYAAPVIVTSGVRTSMPHAVPTEKKFEWGDLVIADFCVRKRGYVCDMTRMFSIGEPTKETLRLYSLLLWSVEEAADIIAPGRAAAEIDLAARGVIRSAGLGDCFTHGVGHGIGIAVHEMPSINQFSGARLAEGDTITLEPGFYKPGWGGMRVEDDYLVTKTGTRRLTGLSNELYVVV